MLIFNDLMASVGSFMFTWSTLELSLSRKLLDEQPPNVESTPRIRGTFRERLDRWRTIHAEDTDTQLLNEIAEQAQKLREFRNLVVHGLAGGHSAPNEGRESYIECLVGGWEGPTCEVRRITDAELKHHTEVADACRRAFNWPSAFNHRL